jgi:hypothetical protein
VERVTGGRWRRIVLGDILAEHVVELRRVEGGGTGGGGCMRFPLRVRPPAPATQALRKMFAMM